MKRIIKAIIRRIKWIILHFYHRLISKRYLRNSSLVIKHIRPSKLLFFEFSQQYARYLLRGQYKGTQVFIKLGINYQNLANELVLFNMLGSVPCNIVTPIVTDKYNVSNNHITLIVLPFIQLKSVKPPISNNLIQDAVAILDILYKKNVVHADISSKNVFISDNRLVLIDFDDGFHSVIDKPIDYLVHGNYIQKKGDYYIFDDAYSFYCYFQSILNKEKDFKKRLNDIKERIGRLQLRFDIVRKKAEITKNF